MFNNLNKGGQGGGLFSNTQGAQQGGGGGLFGNQQQAGAGGGGLFSNQQQGGQQQQGGGGGLFSNQNRPQGGGLFGGQQQGGSTLGGGSNSLFNKGTGGTTGGGLFGNQQQQGGGLFSGQQQGGGGLFGGQSGGSLFGGQRPPGTSLFGGVQQQQQQQMFQQGGYVPSSNRFQLSITNPTKDKKVGSLMDKYKKFIDDLSMVIKSNKTKIEELKDHNNKIIEEKEELAQHTYELSQNSKELYLRIKQARHLVDDMKSSFSTYEELTKDFDVCLDLLKGGRLPRIDIPSVFMINVTEFFDMRIRELKAKILEIEELVKLPDTNEDGEEYEKIIMILDELYRYYIDVAHKVFQLNDTVTTMKVQFIDYFRSQGNREVEKMFTTRNIQADRTNILGLLEKTSNSSLENKMKAKKEKELVK